MAITRPLDHYTRTVAQCIAGDLAMPDRLVSAARARVLRKRGETIRFDHFTVRGRARYRWVAAIPREPREGFWPVLEYGSGWDGASAAQFEQFTAHIFHNTGSVYSGGTIDSGSFRVRFEEPSAAEDT